ncbi:MAG: hypothetical protein AB1473_16825 [Thermodesulfobacteriota bacterium]
MSRRGTDLNVQQLALMLAALVMSVLMGMTSIFAQERSSAPSPLQIDQNFLKMSQEALQRELRETRRCIDNALLNLRDVRGNVNRVNQVDLIDCRRRLSQVQRKIQQLGRAAERLNIEAQAQAAMLQQILRERQRAARVEKKSDQ